MEAYLLIPCEEREGTDVQGIWSKSQCVTTHLHQGGGQYVIETNLWIDQTRCIV